MFFDRKPTVPAVPATAEAWAALPLAECETLARTRPNKVLENIESFVGRDDAAKILLAVLEGPHAPRSLHSVLARFYYAGDDISVAVRTLIAPAIAAREPHVFREHRSQFDHLPADQLAACDDAARPRDIRWSPYSETILSPMDTEGLFTSPNFFASVKYTGRPKLTVEGDGSDQPVQSR